jgi:hypothetical protein
MQADAAAARRGLDQARQEPAADAAASGEKVTCPSMRFVAVKTEAQD